MTSCQELPGSSKTADVPHPDLLDVSGAPNCGAVDGGLSEGQKGLWVLQRMAPESGALNIPLCFRTRRPLNIDVFKRACRFILERNPVLADAVAEERGIPCRAAIPQSAPSVVEGDISALDESAILGWLKAQAERPFSLSSEPLMRVHLLRRSSTETVVLIVFHHIAWDGNSIPPFLTELLDAYQGLLQDKVPEGDGGGLNHADFVTWEREMLAGDEGPMHLAYWKDYLSGAPPFIELPLDGPRIELSGFANEKIRHRVSGKAAEEVRACARSLGITPAVFFLGLYQLLLGRYARSNDIVVGATVAIRPDPAFANVIGYCTNIIPIYTRVDPAQGWPDFISEVQSSAASCLDHAAYPFPLLVRELRPPRQLGRRPIFQVAFNYQNFGSQLIRLREAYAKAMSAEFLEEVVQGVWYELEMMIVEEGESSFRIDLKYDPQLFHSSTASRMMDDYLRLMWSVIADPSKKLCQYPLFSGGERRDKRGRKDPMRPKGSAVSGSFDASAGVYAWVERQVSAIWQNALARDAIGVNDNFFEVGGDSGLAVFVAEGIKTELNFSFSLMDLFRYPTIRECSGYIARSISSDTKRSTRASV